MTYAEAFRKGARGIRACELCLSITHIALRLLNHASTITSDLLPNEAVVESNMCGRYALGIVRYFLESF